MALSRRRVLKTVGVSAVGLTALSGCSRLLHGETKLEQLALVNITDAEHDVRAVVRRDGEEVYRNAFSLPPADANGDDPYPAPIIDEEWMRDPGRFTVECTLKSKENVETRRFPSKRRNGDCFRVEIVVWEGPYLTVPSTGEGSCRESTGRTQS
ncbi:hypothetical protein M0R88_10640 [Halorussus gelatinilyticus]|uniref:Uncharacterized protein n=1 Tax=Halorussus gelatinilyticus TaxID=2937524 RepID=A0A8U0IE44_9EURY|nr:hypothetical protein [Halorussus gelatinilyticus]UPV98985.1 hypothetical protein M0R88_10640 [Halorussus gelatinilyticus]